VRRNKRELGHRFWQIRTLAMELGHYPAGQLKDKPPANLGPLGSFRAAFFMGPAGVSRGGLPPLR